MPPLIDLTGQTFGRLFVVKRDLQTKTKTGGAHWICQCDCGKLVSVGSNNLKRKDVKTKSCGCYQKEFIGNLNKSHGDRHSKFYMILNDIKQRCNNPNNQAFYNYGGRGISVCERWSKYENFKEDMYESYLDHRKKHNGDTTIERKNVNGNYELSNCIWVTKYQQSRNRRNNILFLATYTNPGPSFGYKEIGRIKKDFAEKYNLKDNCIGLCLKGKQPYHKGWVFKCILWEGE